MVNNLQYQSVFDVSEWLRSKCCDSPVFLVKEFIMDLEWVYCINCCQRIGVILGEEKYG